VRVFSGIQPSGIIHIGNYVGAIKNWIKIQQEHDSIFCIVDYHAITVSYDFKKMPDTIFNTAAILLSCGIDPKKSKLFIQSDIKEHTELAWILSTFTSYGDLTRMTQFKDKSKQHTDNINAGLFFYPVLMAADILLYKAEIVPVGLDQLQHLELTREITRKFNYVVGNIFPEPKEMLSEVPKILGLDGEAKMSKSMNNYISLIEEDKDLWEKIKDAKTDERRIKRTDPGDPDTCNIFNIHKVFSKKDEIEMINTECRKAGIGCIDCKKILNKNLLEFITPIREKVNYYKNNKNEVIDILKESSNKCRKIAEETMEEVKSKMGLILN